jgi:5'-nucleotidase
MNLLITNDDGIHSPGLRLLAEVAAEFGTVHIVAPESEQSSTGQAITHNRPLRPRRTKVADFDGLRVNGTPADCVALGCHLYEHVDVVLSGVNLGPNIGNATWHSGTLAAAKQAALLARRGIALSTLTTGDETDLEPLRTHVKDVLSEVLPLGELKLLNVNFPLAPRGRRWTSQSVRHYDGIVVPAEDPHGRQLYWVTVRPIEQVEENTDRWAIQHGFTSITPLRLDLTDHEALEQAERLSGAGSPS